MSILWGIIAFIVLGLFLESYGKIEKEEERRKALRRAEQEREAAHKAELQRLEQEARARELEEEAAQRQKLRELEHSKVLANKGIGLNAQQIFLWVVAFVGIAILILLYFNHLPNTAQAEIATSTPSVPAKIEQLPPVQRPLTVPGKLTSAVPNPFQVNAAIEASSEPEVDNDWQAEVVDPFENAGQIVEASDARSVVNQYRTVCGQVAQIRPFSKGTYINLGQPYPNQDLTIVIWDSGQVSATNFKTQPGQRLCIEGGVSSYNGRPQIIFSSIDQLK